jgi:protein-tyrosine phosphatase
MDNQSKPQRILFVCMGNICRSPAAEGVLKHILNQYGSFNLDVESCGIGDWHIGQAPDMRMQETAKARGIALTSRAQQFNTTFFDVFDYILVSDHEVMKFLYKYAQKPEHKAKIALMTEYSSNYKGQEVPDPYYEPDAAFDLVLDMLEDSCKGLLKHVSEHEK